MHRDLKPGNVLVTADGIPKLLDFGIARLVRPAGEPGVANPTVTAFRMLTPDYASPEQVRGEAVTTATDVYSLGVILYELLSGQRPYRTGHVHEVLAAICDEDPERPSVSVTRTGKPTTGRRPGPRCGESSRETWTRSCSRRCARLPNERYASVEAFADDVTRHLEGRPVRARPHTLAYRTGKFVRRNPAAVAAGVLLGCSLVAGLTATLWQNRRAEAQKARAERRFNDVRKLANAVVGDLHDAIKDLPGATPARKLLVTHAVEYLDSLAGEAGGDESLQRELAGAYLKIGDAQGNPYLANLGDSAGALRSYQKAFEIHARLSGARPDDEELRRVLAVSHERIAEMLWSKGEYPEALDRYRTALGIHERLASVDDKRLDDRYGAARVLSRIGQLQIQTGDLPAALHSNRRSLALMSALAAASPKSLKYRRGVATIVLKIGDIGQSMHDYHTAFASHSEAERMVGELSRENPDSADLQRTHGLALARLANDHMGLQRPAEAVAAGRGALAVQKALAAADPENRQIRIDMSATYGALGEALNGHGETAAAIDAVRQGIAIRAEARAQNPAYSAEDVSVARLYLILGALLLKTGQTAGALAAYGRAADVVAVEPVRSEAPTLVAEIHAGAGDAQAQRARVAPAESRAMEWRAARHSYEQSLAIWVSLSDQGKLTPDQADRPNELEQRIKRCVAALDAPRR